MANNQNGRRPEPLTYERAVTSVERTRVRLRQAEAELRMALDILGRLDPRSRNGLEESSLESFLDQLRAAEADLVRRAGLR